jgi:hypothetical protein
MTNKFVVDAPQSNVSEEMEAGKPPAITLFYGAEAVAGVSK